MLKLRLLCVGKISSSYLKQAVVYYQRLLQNYCSLEIIEIKENKSEAKELEKLQRLYKKAHYCLALTPLGEMRTSKQFAQKLSNLQLQGYANIDFIIGGANGLMPSLLETVDFQFSFSRLTFPHQLFRIMLLEQLYRCLSYNQGHPYHRE